MKWIVKGIIFFSLIGMFNIFLEEDCYFVMICSMCVLIYMTYRAFKKICDFDFWGDVINPNYNQSYHIGYDNYDYLNTTTQEDKNHIVVDGSKNYNPFIHGKFKEIDHIKSITEGIKRREDKIQVIETTVKEVKRPITKVENRFVTKSDKKTNKDKENEKVVINPDEFNKDLIMVVNSSKISKGLGDVYDCIIKALKDLKHSTSSIANILQVFPYIDFVNDYVVIYVNKRQIEGITLSKLKRHIITNINEKFENKVKTSFEDLKYISVYDYFNKISAL